MPVFRQLGLVIFILLCLNSEMLVVFTAFGKLLQQVSVKYYLISRGDPVEYTLITGNVTSTRGWKLSNDPDNPLPLALIMHGMGGSLDSPINDLVGKAILESYREWNIVSVDYSEAIQTDYLSAVQRVMPVSQEIANWLLDLIDNGDINPENVTLIGFSLGAHVAGITGFVLREENVTIGRIVALDPALPSFESVKEYERLNKEDANLVTVVHTTGGNIAFAEPLGHIDFYPNGGIDPQPMCFSAGYSSSWLKIY